MAIIDSKKLNKINANVFEKGVVDREHLLQFLESMTTSDGKQLADAVRGWLQDLHNDPKYSKIIFPSGDIDAIIGDLDSYGRLQPETILGLKGAEKSVPTS